MLLEDKAEQQRYNVYLIRGFLFSCLIYVAVWLFFSFFSPLRPGLRL